MWYRKAAHQGDREALYNLALCYLLGIGVEKNSSLASQYMQASAVRGYPSAIFYTSKRALENFYQRAAADTHLFFQYQLASYYEHRWIFSKNFPKAFSLYRQAAEHRYAPAQYALGSCYYEGRGIEKNPLEGLAWMYLATSNAPEVQEMQPTLLDVEEALGPDACKKAQEMSKQIETTLALIP